MKYMFARKPSHPDFSVLRPVFLLGALLMAGCNGNNDDGSLAQPLNKNPVAVLVATPAADGITITITDKAVATDKGIYDPDGRVVKAVLDYGDGQKTTSTAALVSSLLLSHTYAANGTYTLTLTVWDNDGASATARKILVVKAVPVDNVYTGLLNDTGITFCADDATMLTDCSPATLGVWADVVQDAQTGRDALAAQGKLLKAGAGHAGFDYTKIGADGQRLPASAKAWSCVLDNHTGLMWEVKTADGGLRDWRHRYTWYNPDATMNGGIAGYQDSHDRNPIIPAGSDCGNSLRQCNTWAFEAKVNELGLCGHKDWQVPGMEQLLGLPDYGRSQPFIDTAYFPNTAFSEPFPERYGVYWSSSSLVADARYARIVYFYGGNGLYTKDIESYVRLVRARQ